MKGNNQKALESQSVSVCHCTCSVLLPGVIRCRICKIFRPLQPCSNLLSRCYSASSLNSSDAGLARQRRATLGRQRRATLEVHDVEMIVLPAKIISTTAHMQAYIHMYMARPSRAGLSTYLSLFSISDKRVLRVVSWRGPAEKN